MDETYATLLDGHVHFHHCFDVREFLTCAYANFARTAGALGYGDRFAGFLLLTETASAHWFGDLVRSATVGDLVGGWRVVAGEDVCHVKLVEQGGATLNVISGYQVVTAEKLEVLTLGCRDRIPDGRPLADVLQSAAAMRAVTVVPWGFGKWLGRRGRHVAGLIERVARRELFLGDNSNRLASFPEPSILRRARLVGGRVLPGTDPLPFPREARRTGTVGFVLESSSAQDAESWSTLQAKLRREDSFSTFGELESPWWFLRNQVAMQVYKRLRAA